ncbi:MerR family transcriptional regulator [Bacillus thuringiensis]|uniref:MerR family transcriptional regulator n=1 Tax=Bacillus cereus group TaxID=86661 RepID=UPI002DBDDBD4|nr:MerR family transcriptional regulator [Bacillus thuringiensis]MEC3226591.1 MerR family transcriptional regulator [Bacillus thuringiensis]MEC3461686.1 MerR family transcriptional regulator [Bacillus thuringiensis]MEC3553386.1 MerR family transcriptional regulator [Bacillus thuringiensis]MED2059569.1 MerR family transcriptional regulator [Bacillus thuringiensis]
MDFGRFSGQVSKELDVNGNTLRVWCLELENAGYKFERNNRQQRIYYEHDIAILKEMKVLMADGTRTLQEAISILLESSLSEDTDNALTHTINDSNGSETTPFQRNNSAAGVAYAILEQTNEKVAELIKQQQTIALQNQEILSVIHKDNEEKRNVIQAVFEKQQQIIEQQQDIHLQNQNITKMYLDEREEKLKERQEKNELKEQLSDMQEKMNEMLKFVHQQSEERSKSFLSKFFSKKS